MADFNRHPLCKSLAARDGSQSFNHGLKDFQHLRLVPGVVVAKRFVDTVLGRKAWFRKLSPRLKCAWRFLTEECDQVGIWSIDLDSMEFHIGIQVLQD